MYLRIFHQSAYTYAHPVCSSQNELRLIPVSDAFQVCHAYRLEVTPEPLRVLKSLDFFTNQVEHFNVDPSHDKLTITAYSEVETFADLRNFDAEIPRAKYDQGEAADLHYDFLHESHRVRWTPELWRQSVDLTADQPLGSGAVGAINRYIFEAFEYAPGETGVNTPMAEVLQTRRGVCQDFAHIMLAHCRAVGIPTRYVSGYFLFRGEGESARLSNEALSAGASHAWVECLLPGVGWVGYDPTHGCQVDQRYVKVAVGRDYSDVRPISGTYRGKAKAELEVQVEVVVATPEVAV